jgi:predicted nucleic acid-binding protein
VDVVLVDAGPLIALFDPADNHHEWAAAVLRRLPSPFLTCDAVIAEVTHRLVPGSSKCIAFVVAVERGLVRSAFDLGVHIGRVRSLMERYRSVPMSFADACLVRMTELQTSVVVWTTDSDFRVYRRHGRQRIPSLEPD